MKIIKFLLIPALLMTLVSCSEEEEKSLRNDFIMKTVSPAITGETLEFAYAMGALEGTLAKATARVDIAGATGSGFNPKSYHADSRGNDIGVTVAEISVDENQYNADFIVDTVAATLRFNYVVPEEAKGQEISIVFSAESTTGESVSLTTPRYKISQMDIKRDIILSNDNSCYFSLETMRGYTAAEVVSEGMQEKIDLIYIYDALNPEGYIYGHSLVSPGTDEKYLNGRVVPEGFARNKSRIEKQVYIRDMQLSGMVPGHFVDDPDLQTLDMEGAADFILGINTFNSAFVESADGQYRAYLYFNQARSRKLTFGIKRLKVK